MAMQAISDHDLDALGEEFSARLRAGERPSIDEFVERYSAEAQPDVRDFLESIQMIEELKSSAGGQPNKAEAIPQNFGRYRILQSLGEGGMGAVYLALDTQLDRKVALKTPKFSRGSEDNLVQRFYREARSAATLQHPNICPVYDVGEIDGIHYISMAYIEGRPLSDFIRRDKLPPIDSALKIIRKVALALHEAHQEGLIHRDLKPANIMISRRNEPVVMDFGLARQFDSSDESAAPADPQAIRVSELQKAEARLTLDGTVVGSPGYMPPEQLMGDSTKVGPASDVYALGVVLFELLTGQLPFPGDGSLMSIINAVMTKEPPDVRSLRPEAGDQVAAVCRKALAKRPEERYPTMQAFAVALTHILRGNTVAPSDDDSAKSASVHGGVSPDTVRINEQKELARSLYQEGQYVAAMSILEKMAASKDSASGELVQWARKELPRVRAKAEAAANESRLTDADDFWQSPLNEAAETAALPGLPTSRSRQKLKRQRQSAFSRKKAVIAGVVAVLFVAAVIVGFKRFGRKQHGRPLATANMEENGKAHAGSSETGENAPTSSGGTVASGEMETQTTETKSPAQQPSNGSADTPRPGLRFPPFARNERPGVPADAARIAPRERFWRMDRNHDGLLTREELESAPAARSGMFRRIVQQFDRFDTSPRDNALNQKEAQQLMQFLSRQVPGNSPFPGQNRRPMPRD